MSLRFSGLYRHTYYCVKLACRHTTDMRNFIKLLR
ncbi:unnamed protein product [Schistosoma margrebowiei]|uniref:Uncharacterized protein n=1 Tax=Schistosoma margrebowiei TaxID=48269 RepID=A0A183LEX4_9TREM|nr:unnamed protein product [Schistosoma margrebowiei]